VSATPSWRSEPGAARVVRHPEATSHPTRPGRLSSRLAISRLGLRGYALALLSSLAALGAALGLAPVFGDLPVPLFLAAVMVSAWSSGLGPGLLATVFAGVALDRLFDLSRGSPLGWEDTAVDVAVFVAVALLISALNARLRLLYRRIEAARVEAEAAVRARDQLLSVVVHDLKSPLAGISMSAQLADRRLTRGDADGRHRVHQHLLDIQTGTQRMLGLIDDLLDVAYLRAGQGLLLHRQPTRLVEIVEQAVGRHQSTSQKHTLHLVAQADPSGVWDAARLARVLDNLLSNAIKYSPQGGDVWIEVGVDEGRAADGCAVVRVRDNGIGIPAQDAERIFSSFFRARNVGSIPGTGIGLAGARQIVEQHGGRLTVASSEGSGTTFTLRLPLDK
jgi:signal transduction histidine kinase